MRKFLICLLSACFWLASDATRAQFVGEGVLRAVPASASFQGPGDSVASAAVYWSCTIAYTAAYANAHSNACDIVRASDSATCTMVFASSGVVDTTVATSCAGATVASFCNATTCSITKAYDQTGNAVDGTPAIPSFDPVLTFNGLGTCPVATLVGANQSDLRNIGYAGIAQPATAVVIANFTSNGASGDLGPQGNFQVDASVSGSINAGASLLFTKAYSTNTQYAIQGVLNGASSSINLNGSQTTGNIGTGTIGGSGLQIGRSYDGNFVLFGFWASAFSAGQITAMNTLLRSYCGGF